MPLPAILLPLALRALGGAGGFVFSGGPDVISRQFDEDPTNNPSPLEWAMILGATGGGVAAGPWLGSTVGGGVGMVKQAVAPPKNAGAVAPAAPPKQMPKSPGSGGGSAITAPNVRGKAPSVSALPTRPSSVDQAINRSHPLTRMPVTSYSEWQKQQQATQAAQAAEAGKNTDAALALTRTNQAAGRPWNTPAPGTIPSNAPVPTGQVSPYQTYEMLISNGVPARQAYQLAFGQQMFANEPSLIPRIGRNRAFSPGVQATSPSFR